MRYLSTIQLIKPNDVNLPQTKAESLAPILNIVFVFIGALALFMLVVASLQYILAQGSPDKTSQAKNRIVYILMGLIIIALAASAVNFAIGRTATG